MKTCVIYVCNARYLVPAMVSAGQARANVAPELADVFVFDIGPPSEAGTLAARAAESLGVRYVRHDESVLDGMTLYFGRMMVDRLLPDGGYKDFIYLDSDTQVWDGLDELARAPAPPGRIMAARDPMTVLIASGLGMSKRPAEYLESLELRAHAVTDYVNTGMLKVNLGDWKDVAAECVRFARASDRVFVYHDQDLINCVASGQFSLVSVKWNFPAFLLKSGIERLCAPRMVHFMSNPRPWHGAFHPWGAAGARAYDRFTADHPGLRPFQPRLSHLRYMKYVLQQQYKRASEGPVWKNRRFREEFVKAEQSVAF